MLRTLLRALAGGLAAALLASIIVHLFLPSEDVGAVSREREDDSLSDAEAEQLLRELSSLT